MTITYPPFISRATAFDLPVAIEYGVGQFSEFLKFKVGPCFQLCISLNFRHARNFFEKQELRISNYFDLFCTLVNSEILLGISGQKMKE